MSLASIRPGLITAHRWVGLVLSPIFLLVVLSGAVLSFRPIVEDLAAPAAAVRVDAAALDGLVKVLQQKSPPTAVTVVEGGRAVDVAAADPAVAGRWDLATGVRADVAPTVDVFAIAESLHKNLLVGLGLLVEIAAWAMLAIVVVGPFLTWLHFRNTLIGWHMAIGWCLLPLVVLAPLTGVLMTLHVGQSATPLPRAARPVSVAEALTIAAPKIDLSTLTTARRFRAGTVLVETAGATPATFVVTDTAAVRLEGGPGWVKEVHEGTWAGAWSGLLNFVVSLALLALTVTGAWSWIARRRRDRPTALAAGADLLVAHASQTGTATRLAEATARALEAGGETVAVAPLGTLTSADLRRFRLVLLVASTTGEGEIPDGARRFAAALEPNDLDGVRFAVLGLGDRGYANFCGGAERLRTALSAAGAEEALAFARADGEPTAAWRDWLAELDLRLGLRLVVDPNALAVETVPLRLVDRRRLDDPVAGDTQETWAVTLAADADLDFRPGDLLRLAPAPGERERAYSIGSSALVDPRRIDLTVKLHRWSDAAGEGLGHVSGRLCRDAPLGSPLEARITPHPSFRPPEDPARPILMIAAGTGIAPFPGFLAERARSGRPGPAWLVFGNRHAAGDFLWRDRLEAARADGSLDRLDTAFSRDPDDGARVQTRLAQAADDVRHWLTETNALVYVCGRRAMAEAALAALAAALGEDGTAEIDRRVADGRVRLDLFD